MEDLRILYDVSSSSSYLRTCQCTGVSVDKRMHILVELGVIFILVGVSHLLVLIAIITGIILCEMNGQSYHRSKYAHSPGRT